MSNNYNNSNNIRQFPTDRYEQYRNALNNSVEDRTVYEVTKQRSHFSNLQKLIATVTVSVILLTGAIHIIKKADVPEKISSAMSRIADDDEALKLANEIIERYNYRSHLASDGMHVWFDEPKTIFSRIVNAEGEFYNEPKENIENILGAVYIARGDEAMVSDLYKLCCNERGEDIGIDINSLTGDDWGEKRHELCEMVKNGTFGDYRDSLVQTKGGK